MTDPSRQRPRIAPGYRLQWEEAQQCHVLLYPEGMVTLNHSAGEILRHCDGERTTADVVAALERAYPGAALADDVLRFLTLAREKGWLVFS